jgi:hypothetical protein
MMKTDTSKTIQPELAPVIYNGETGGIQGGNEGWGDPIRSFHHGYQGFDHHVEGWGWVAPFAEGMELGTTAGYSAHPGYGYPVAHPYAAGYPYAGHPYAGHPYAGHPYAGHPYAGFPYAGFPYAGHPYASHPYGGFPHVGYPYGGHPYAGYPHGTTTVTSAPGAVVTTTTP